MAYNNPYGGGMMNTGAISSGISAGMAIGRTALGRVPQSVIDLAKMAGVDLAIDAVTGQITTKKKRRCRRRGVLFTASELSSMAGARAVLGGGKAFNEALMIRLTKRG